MKKIIFTFVVILMLVVPTSSYVANQVQSSSTQISGIPSIPADILGNVTNISIENIVGGAGLTVLFKNKGGADLFDRPE